MTDTLTAMTETLTQPPHPYFCDECGGRAPFKIKYCPIAHALLCPRHGEDPVAVYERAKAYCLQTGKAIP